jgi:hypothetical protein
VVGVERAERAIAQHAATVACEQRQPLMIGRIPLRPPEVERRTFTAQHHGADVLSCGQATHLGDADRTAVGAHTVPGATQEVVEVDEHHHRGAQRPGTLGAVVRALHHLDQRVGHPLRVGDAPLGIGSAAELGIDRVQRPPELSNGPIATERHPTPPGHAEGAGRPRPAGARAVTSGRRRREPRNAVSRSCGPWRSRPRRRPTR